MLQTYNGCGEVLYTVDFKNFTVVSDKVNFDYQDSEASTRRVMLKYKCAIRDGENENTKSISIQVNNREFVEITDDIKPPKIDIEECEYNFLNQNIKYPGKAKLLNILLPIKDIKHLIEEMTNNKMFDVTLVFDYKIKKEIWFLKNCFLTSLLEDFVLIGYSSVNFSSTNYNL